MEKNAQKIIDDYQLFSDWLFASDWNTIESFLGAKENKEYAEDVKFMRNLRNIVAHKSKRYVLVTDDAVKRVDELVARITCGLKPKMIPLKNLFIGRLNGQVLPALRMLKEKNYSYLPILNDDNTCYDVFSAYTLMSYLCTGKIIDKETTFNDIYDTIDTLRLNETVEYVPEKSSILNVMDLMKVTADFHKDVVLVTEDGTENSPLLGMITVWDL